MNTFLQSLAKERSAYAYPSQAATVARGLEQLSSGIYTEDERFVYELLQNAVDAFNDEDSALDVKIVAQDDYLVFMHNGSAFSERDIEGLCDIGNGNKINDAKKIGYKGIGFKSVFRASSRVFVQTGDTCFKFDKAEWDNFWDEKWGTKDCTKQYPMPWQIIPIETTAPIDIDTHGYNVAIYIYSKKIDTLVGKINKLMQSSQFLLFLSTPNVKMSISTGSSLIQEIEKRTIGNEVSLSVNGEEESLWLCHVIPDVEVPEKLRHVIALDEKTPRKLIVEENGEEFSVKTFDLSFAVCIEEKNGERSVKKADNPVIYTYLPTEYKFGDAGFPFLVNANFLTNAGREQLIKDSEWNKMIISRIPKCFLSWVATFSREISNYYEILPEKSYGNADVLQMAYSSAMEEAIKDVSFIPKEQDKEELQCAAMSIIDSLDLRTLFSPQKLIQYVNDKYSRDLTENCWISKGGRRILGDYGVFILGKNELSSLFESEGIFDELNALQSKNLIIFLQQYSEKNPSEKDELRDVLRSTSFIYCRDGRLHAPRSVYFQTNIELSISANSEFICDEIAHECSFHNDIKEWLEFIGVREFSCGEYLNDIAGNSIFIRKDNALEIGKLLYQAYTKGTLGYLFLGNRRHFDLLTANGELKEARQLYMSSVYNPRFDLQKYCNEDIFISDVYKEIGDPDTWHCIFKELGVPDDIQLYLERRTYKEFISVIPPHLQSFINQENEKIESKDQWIYNYGYDIHYFPHCFGNEDNTQLQLLFSKVFSNNYETDDKSKYLECRWNTSEHFMRRGGDYWKKDFRGFNLREFLLKNVQKYPTTIGIAKYASEIFINTPTNIDLCGSYLPVLNISCQISDPLWLSVIPFKRELEIDDLLQILTRISENEEISDEDVFRISKIYSRIIDQYDLRNNNYIRGKIQEWSKGNRVLSVSDGHFYSPSELSYITIDGFSAKYQVYTGHIEDKETFLELLRLFGVQIITEENISLTVEDCEVNDRIRERLISIAPMLALLASSDKDKEYYESKLVKVRQCIEDTVFLSCRKICLTVKDSDAKLEKQTYAENGKFYFVGTIKPATIEPLLTPLCSYLGLKHKERELFVLLIEQDYSSIIEFLKEKEYPIEWLPSDSTSLVETTPAEVGGLIGGDIENERQRAESEEAKTLVLAHLASKGFNVENVNKTYSVISGVNKDDIDYPLVVKSCKNFEHRVNINPDEWQALFKPNSMLWIHAGGGIVLPIKAHELFTYQDKLTLSFDTVNLLMDERVNKIMDVMRYFNNVHLNLATLNTDQHRGESLDDYLFNERNDANNDLSESSID